MIRSLPRRPDAGWTVLASVWVVVCLRHLRLLVEPVPDVVRWLQRLDGGLELGVPELELSGAVLLVLAGAVAALRRHAPRPERVALLGLVAVAATGIALRHFGPADVVGLKRLIRTVLHLEAGPRPPVPWLFLVHTATVAIWIVGVTLHAQTRARLGGWLALGAAMTAAALAVTTSSARSAAAAPAPSGSCLLPANEMRVQHPRLLHQRRDTSIREGRRHPSLARTCFGCHANAGGFCGGCPASVGASPTCLGCHLPPEGTAR
jgi:hypothetical protein